MKNNIHLIVVGPVTNLDANLVGGATISFGHLCDYLQRNQVAHTVVNTQRFPTLRKSVFNWLYVIVKVLLNLFRANVIFLNSSDGGAKYIAPFLFVMAKVAGAKFVFRPFGGNFYDYTRKFNKLHTWLLQRTILKADLLFLQTQYLMDRYRACGVNIAHLPTSRTGPPQQFVQKNKPFRKRFVFAGFVLKEKGIEQIRAAAKRLGSEYTIHIYGPLIGKVYREGFRQDPIYQGVFEQSQTWTVLNNYDVLILPSFYKGEGYAGCIIEAYAMGMPVIATNWRALPEIVAHGKTGRLIEAQSTEALVQAIRFFKEDNYSAYASRARQYFEQQFDADQVALKTLQQIEGLFPGVQKVYKPSKLES